MTTKYKEPSEEEVLELVGDIARTTFKYMMKRIDNKIMVNKSYQDIPIDTFICIILSALSCININSIKWISNFYTNKTGNVIDEERLVRGLIDQVNAQLDTVLH